MLAGSIDYTASYTSVTSLGNKIENLKLIILIHSDYNRLFVKDVDHLTKHISTEVRGQVYGVDYVVFFRRSF